MNPASSASFPNSQPAAEALDRLLAQFEPFNLLGPEVLAELASVLVIRDFRLGQTLLEAHQQPTAVYCLLQGQLRVLAPNSGGASAATIDRLGPGALVGWCGLVRRRPCEAVRAMGPVKVLELSAEHFEALLEADPSFAGWFHRQLPHAELHQLLRELVLHQPAYAPYLDDWLERELAVGLISQARNAPLPDEPRAKLLWLYSSGGLLAEAYGVPAAAPATDSGPSLPWLRLIGFPEPPQELSRPLGLAEMPAPELTTATDNGAVTAVAPSLPPLPISPISPIGASLSLPRASGPEDIPLAIATALARYFNLPLNRDSLRDFISGILRQQAKLNLTNAGQLLDYLGLRVIMTKVPLDRLYRAPVPAVLEQHGQLVLLDGVDDDGLLCILDAELGPLQVPLADVQADEQGQVELLLLDRRLDSMEARFGWGWFMPYIRPHRRELIEVVVASSVVNLLALVTPLGLQVLIDQVARYQNMSVLISISALLLIAGVATAIVRTLRTYIFAQVANRIDQDSKSTILDRLVRLPQGFFDSRPVGQIIYYFNMLDRLREFLLGQALTTVVDFAFAILYVIILVAINPLLTLVTLSTLPLMLILALVTNPVFEGQVRRSIDESVKTYSFLNEAITGIQTIKSQNAETKTRWEFLNRYSRFIGEDFKLKLTTESINNTATFINDLNSLLVIGFGIWLVMQNQLTLGGFIAFRIISGYITRPLVQLVQTWQQFRITARQLQLVGDVVDRNTEQSETEATNIPMPPVRGHVRLENVSFRFNEDGPLILQGINLDIPEGCFVGMVGGSGSGKSTVLKLLPRFYRALEGKVLVDGFDVTKVELYSLRRQVGVVPQDSLLFDGTIRENLLLVKPDATVEEMIRATRIACAHDFIMEMPQGYNSSVGERGAGLSGGQRQRLAIARAVLQNPRMLIFDEATSALDARTERELCRNLFEAFRGRTVFFITHRLSTVRPADQIVLMDRGAVMETGSHDQLMALQGWYYALYKSQNLEGLS
jgi:ATP-binding cassette subfamily B protein